MSFQGEDFVGIAAFFLMGTVLYYMIKKNFDYEESERKKKFENNSKNEAQELSKKLRDSRVEMGLRKPASFKTKRKPQKTVKT